MSNEEAIDILSYIKTKLDDSASYAEHDVALGMAIKALEQQPSENVEVIQVSKGALKSRQGRFVVYDVDWLKEHFYTTEEKLYGQPKQPCEDCVSRNEIIHTLNTMDRYVANELTLCNTDEKYPKNEVFIVDDVYELIVESLPSVTPQQKRGKWIEQNDTSKHHYGWYYCSECEAYIMSKCNYCSECGSDNRDLESLGKSFADGYEDGLEET